MHARGRSAQPFVAALALAIAGSLGAATAEAAPAASTPPAASAPATTEPAAAAAPAPPSPPLPRSPAPAAISAPPRSPAQSSGPTTFVLEAHTGERPSSVAAIIDPVLDELERRGFVARPGSVIKQLGGRAPRPGILDGGKTAAEIAQQVESGFDAFTKGKYKDAAAALALAVHQIKRNPGLLVLDATNARATFHAFVGLALSQSKLGYTAESIETMTELLRTFSTQSVTRTEYGPQAEQFYRSVQRQTLGLGHGRLAISAGNEHAMIFVDGELRGMGKAALADLIPGTYRVFIQVPGTAGRQYEAEVQAGGDSTLDIDWHVDSALVVSNPWVGFVFASDAERVKEAAYAAALAHRWASDTIVVVGTTRLHDRAGVIATMYRATGDVVRSALVVPGDHEEARLQSLARFIAEGTPSDVLERVTGAVAPPPPTERVDAPASARVPLGTKLGLGAGAALVTAGVVALVIDQDPDPGRRYYRDAAPLGVALGLAGAASIGVGLWWWHHRRGESAAPAVSLGPSHAWLGWAGRF